MNIKAVIHKNGLPLAVNFQTDGICPVGVQLGCGARALMGLQPHGARSDAAARTKPPAALPGSACRAPAQPATDDFPPRHNGIS